MQMQALEMWSDLISSLKNSCASTLNPKMGFLGCHALALGASHCVDLFCFEAVSEMDLALLTMDYGIWILSVL